MYEAIVGDKTYKIHMDEQGSPVGASTYNPKYKMRVELSFSRDDNLAYRNDVREILKSLYISDIYKSKISV